MFQLVLADDTSEQNHVRLALSTGGHDDSVSFVDNHELALDSFQGLPFGSELLGGFFSRLIQN